MTTTDTRPGYRAPWTHGAYAYPEADTFADLAQGMKRKRKLQMVHMPNTGEAGDQKCYTCGRLLKEIAPDYHKVDKWSTWTYYPKSKLTYGEHYVCSWMSLMNQILDVGRAMQL